MKIHPDMHKWQCAKQAAFALAAACGATIGQSPTGKPRLFMGSKITDWPTWLSLWTQLHRIRLDQITPKS